MRAYARASRTRKAFDLICFGGGEFSRAEQSFLVDSCVADRVHCQSGDDSTLLHYYLHARAFIMPSIYEGFGLPLLEAMSAGCPVLSSDIPTAREVAGDTAAYFPAEDTAAMSEVLEAVLFDDALLGGNANAGRTRAADFSWSKCASETAAVYRSLCAS